MVEGKEVRVEIEDGLVSIIENPNGPRIIVTDVRSLIETLEEFILGNRPKENTL